ncbi:MAG TPA: Fe-S protein assembly co-chaperone HscB [Candidatus Acidoferrum sp.]|nr:Fe-S protein assembly co-chaperone HscB [Candidatus Acidoferrum sp.]
MSAVSTPTKSARACWSCGAVVDSAHFCVACKKIQPLDPGKDYFALFGLPRKLRIDSADLEKRFHQLSWKLHPDNFIRTSEKERELSLALSSELNDAYRALREPLSRVEYLLAQAGMRKEGAHKQQAPPELLEEVFELNESLDELREARAAGGDASHTSGVRKKLEAAAKDFEAKLAGVDAELDCIAGEWDAALDACADEPAQKALMGKMNEVLNRRSYIRNLVNKVNEELAA